MDSLSFTFHLLSRQHFPLFVHWLEQPHIARWWHEPATLEHVETKYGPSVDGTEKTTIYIVELNQKPLGMVQTYLLQDYPEHADSAGMVNAVGVDLFIGEPEYIGKGYGSQMLKEFIDKIIRVKYSNIEGVIADPSVGNPASIRMFEKAGFVKGKIVEDKEGQEQLMILKF